MIKTITNILVAVVLVAVAGPALAKKRSADEASAARMQAKTQATKTCRRTPPPFMYNPRYMNRGFFKRKCRNQGK